jgi:DNA polymerase III epsilon subunit-like protein
MADGGEEDLAPIISTTSTPPQFQRLYVFDTETSGHKGVPSYKAVGLQYCVLNTESNECLDLKVNHEGIYLHPENVKIHQLGRKDLEREGLPEKDIIQQLISFIGPPLDDEGICLIAHNAQFDLNVFRGAYERALKEPLGRGGVQGLKWKFFDTLHFFKDRYPDIGLQYPQGQKPYSLSTLCRHFLGLSPSNLHNAKNDVDILWKLFQKVVIPDLKKREDWDKYIIGGGNSPPPPQLTLLSHLTGFGLHRSRKVAEELRKHSALYPQFAPDLFACCTDGLCMVVHLIGFGMMRINQLEEKGKKKKVENEKWEMCRHVEILLREPPIRINCDNTLAVVLSFMMGVDVYDLLFHTMKEDGDTKFFPTLHGTPRAWLPLQFSEEETRDIEKELNWGTIAEMTHELLLSPATYQDLKTKLGTCLTPRSLPQLDNLETICRDLIKYSSMA